MTTKFKFYSTKQTAKILHICPEVLTRKCRNGEINYRKSGRKYLFTEDDIQNFTTGTKTK